MRIAHRPIAPGLLLFALLGAAHAADGGVYRCGQTYQQLPCEGGQAIDASDARTEDQRRDAQAAASAEQRHAGVLAAERREREKKAAPQPEPVVIGVRQPQAAASAPAAAPDKTTHKPRRKKPSRPDEPRYSSPAAPRKT
ncbi:hypothetical protein [Ideonella sp. YS5]|uniref:hypothetical protein n=1 Tax=Ideonella sp. YS5 TaxID=3453714 RepID=UPI003EE869CE